MSNNSLEIVHEGWLIKSPPTKPIWRARWRRRWFVLRHSGELPGQYFLEYYTDKNCQKLKGKIDLDQCEQVDAGMKYENHKHKYQYLFDVRTPKRTFYLAAESEKEMNKWVACVCHVCGLKPYNPEDEYYVFMPPAEEVQGDGSVVPNPREPSAVPTESNTLPRVQGSNTPVSISGPYIPISECISGRPLNENGLIQLKLNGDVLPSDALVNVHHNNIPNWNSCNSKERIAPHTLPRPYSSSTSSKQSSHATLDLPGEFYDMPRRLHPPNLEGIDQHTVIGTPPLHSPATTCGGTDGESINFIEEDWSANGHMVHTMPTVHQPPNVNWNTYPRDGDGPMVADPKEKTLIEDHATLKFSRCYAKMTITDDSSDRVPRSIAPPRPPKPLHLMEAANKHSYLNLDNISPKYGPEASESLRSSDGEGSCGITPRQSHSNPHSPGQQNCVAISDETYDFPRSHQHGESSRETRHCYSNAAPGRANDVFRYDFHNEDGKDLDEEVVLSEEPTSPRSESSSLTSSSVIYSNLPSPLCPSQVPNETPEISHVTGGAPPAVYRDLKPGRKTSDPSSHELSPGIHTVSPIVPPTVDRTLKPHKKHQDITLVEPGLIKLASPPACRSSTSNRSWRKRKPRAAPSPTPPSQASAASFSCGIRSQSVNSFSEEDAFLSFGDDDVIYYTRNNKKEFLPALPNKSFAAIQYLDLDHPESSGLQHQVPKSPDKSQASSIVYKTVDFVKTEAFKRTKQEVEEERKNCTAAAHDL